MKSGLRPAGGGRRSGPRGSCGRAEMVTGLGARRGGGGGVSSITWAAGRGSGWEKLGWSWMGQLPPSLPFPEKQGGPATLLGRDAEISVGLCEAVVFAHSPEGPPHSWAF